MATALLLAWTSPVPGRAEQYAAWLDEVHVPEVRAAVPAIEHSSRYRLAHPPGSAGPPRFLVVHHLALHQRGTDDLAVAAAELDLALRAGRVTTSPDMDLTLHPPHVEWHGHEADIGSEETQ